jgi:VWFA-related protein
MFTPMKRKPASLLALLPIIVLSVCLLQALQRASEQPESPYKLETQPKLGTQPAPGSASSGNFLFDADLNLVLLGAVVQDHSGRFVPGLTKENFQVYDSGRAQPIKLFQAEDVPVTVGLIVDGSGSMVPKRAETIKAALSFLAYSNPEDEMFVVNFNERVSMGLPPEIPFTNEAEKMRAALMRFPVAGKTALYDAIAAGLRRVNEGRQPKKALIVFSDGGDNASRTRFADILSMAEESNTIIYTVGLFDDQDPDRNPRVLKRLANVTGGQCYLPEWQQDLPAVCQRIARDIRNQYTIGYAAGSDRSYHPIRVVAVTQDHKKLSVRTRTGYVAASHEP